MSNDPADTLKTLHTNAIDARNGYDEALKDAEGRGMTPLFRSMIALHDRNASELEAELGKAGKLADESGSLMTTVHRTVMSIRSLFGGLDETVLPGLIDGEERNKSSYDDALKPATMPKNIETLLSVQRGRIEQAIQRMKSEEAVDAADR